MIRILPCRFTVDFQELDGSPIERITTEFWQGTGATRVFRCASGDRMQLIKELLGYRRGSIIRRPHQYLDISGFVMATSVSTKPIGKIVAQADNRFADYPETEIEVTYTIPPELFEAFGGLVTVTETLRDASEFITLTNQEMFW